MKAFTGEFEGRGVEDYEPPADEEENGGGEGGLKVAAAAKKKGKKKKQISDLGGLDMNFQSTVTFTPFLPTDCTNPDAEEPADGEELNLDPSRCYLGFCKARNENGVENYDSESDTMKAALER